MKLKIICDNCGGEVKPGAGGILLNHAATRGLVSISIARLEGGFDASAFTETVCGEACLMQRLNRIKDKMGASPLGPPVNGGKNITPAPLTGRVGEGNVPPVRNPVRPMREGGAAA